MQKKTISLIALAFLMQAVLPGATGQAVAQSEKNPYPVMAPLNQYLSPDQNSEIALARRAAPASISDRAEVMVLGKRRRWRCRMTNNPLRCYQLNCATTPH